MGNALGVYESRYGVKKAKSLFLREIFLEKSMKIYFTNGEPSRGMLN